MRKLEDCSDTDRFSHIYIEEKAMDHPVAIETIKRLKKAVVVKISHYKDVFCRPQQDFQLQKRTQKLILAVKDSNFLYKGPDICQNFGNSNFYYTSFLLNCIYNCDYCYLQGMYPSANIVAFVNIEDFFSAAEEKAAERGLFLAVSYDTDLLAFEGVIPYSSMWAEFAAGHPQIKIEIRTKSANCMAVSNINPVENVTLAWTLSPQSVIDKYEPLTPSLDLRIKAVNKALARGWNVRLCFDPVILVNNWKEIYINFIDHVFSSVAPEKISDIGIGAFRMPSDYFKRIKKSRFDCDLVHYPFERRDNITRYPEDIENQLLNLVYNSISGYVDKLKIYK